MLYPKAAQLPGGRLVGSFENSQSAVVGQTLPVYRSDDSGTTWQKLADVKAPAYASTDPQVAKYTSNWTNPYLYVLPHDVGALKAGTLLLASVVSGDDAYYREQKAANPAWAPSGDGDRADVAIALYSSTDQGASWAFRNVVAAGGWQGGSAGAVGRTSAANTYRQVDPVWEPHLIAHQGKLVAYYSDENDYLGHDPATGVLIPDPDNATAPDSHGQVLAHRTWDGTSAAWSAPVVDVAGTVVDRGNGKRQIGGGRPGMTTVAPTTDGKWLLTFEYFGGGDNVRYKLADDPLRFFATGGAGGANISALPVPAGQWALSRGGSPVLTSMPDGRILYNAAGSGSVWVNESGRSDGQWKEYRTPMPPGYSRALQHVAGTDRVLILQAAWAGGSTGPVLHADVDLGRSAGDYALVVNRATGQVLATEAGKTQDANLTGDAPDVVLAPRSATQATQRWHLTTKGSGITLLNKGGGRALAIWGGTAAAGTRLAQWVDDGASDKLWTLQPAADGHYKLRSVRDPGLYATAGTPGGPVTLARALDAAADDAQEWQVVTEPAPASVFALRGTQSGRCLDVPDGATGVPVQVYDCVGNANQRVTATPAGELRVGSGCLAAEADRTTPGTRVILWPCNGRTSQQWSFRLDGTIANRANGLVLDVTAFGTANGSPVQLWTATGGANQTWSRG
ncbi:RICIN domain-containing protein [Saccharothrix sp. S26]|uniref:RICIN domain-containing protein n=1 Tax=Saccharothrix sp. S26 TaxID=2907215 RepID=UPI001F170726|nr:RICIN domain-containing protein [Saccharothrix sp. S26]MCE6995544.1 RICIN domain-containing protein [Saccharothrix sp. S26]